MVTPAPRPRRARQPQRKFSEVAEALIRAQGYSTAACSAMNMPLRTWYDYLARWPELKALQDKLLRERDTMIADIAESKFVQAVKRGDRWAVDRALTQKAKHRGYGETTARIEAIQSMAENTQKTVIIIPDNGRYGPPNDDD